MRFKPIVITTLCIAMFGVSASAKDKKSTKGMDPQEMMETYKKLGQPGEAHNSSQAWGEIGPSRRRSGWSPINLRWNPRGPRTSK